MPDPAKPELPPGRMSDSVAAVDAAGSGIEVAARCRLALRPNRSPSGYHRWSNLTFLHWRFDPGEIQRTLPAGLRVDTYRGDAWVGLVPFYMARVRPWWSPPVPGVSWFCETNVRTYVVDRYGTPGVWFYSLDASNAFAVWVARTFWRLPYFTSSMQLDIDDRTIAYRCERKGAKTLRSAVQVHVGDLVDDFCAEGDVANFDNKPQPALAGGADSTTDNQAIRNLYAPSPGVSCPGTLQHFLVERYELFALGNNNHIWSGRVNHAPYRIRSARVKSLHDELVGHNAVQPTGGPDHVAYCDGVDVCVYPLTRV